MYLGIPGINALRMMEEMWGSRPGGAESNRAAFVLC